MGVVGLGVAGVPTHARPARRGQHQLCLDSLWCSPLRACTHCAAARARFVTQHPQATQAKPEDIRRQVDKGRTWAELGQHGRGCRTRPTPSRPCTPGRRSSACAPHTSARHSLLSTLGWTSAQDAGPSDFGMFQMTVRLVCGGESPNQACESSHSAPLASSCFCTCWDQTSALRLVCLRIEPLPQ